MTDVYRRLVRDVGPTLNPDEELGDLMMAERAVHAKQAEREEIIVALEEEVKSTLLTFFLLCLVIPGHHTYNINDITIADSTALERDIVQAKSKAQRPSTVPSQAEHDAHVQRLADQQVAVGKQLNEEQTLLGKKEIELGEWKAERENIEKVDVGASEWVDGRT
jgi:kinetochore protein Spc24